MSASKHSSATKRPRPEEDDDFGMDDIEATTPPAAVRGSRPVNTTPENVGTDVRKAPGAPRAVRVTAARHGRTRPAKLDFSHVAVTQPMTLDVLRTMAAHIKTADDATLSAIEVRATVLASAAKTKCSALEKQLKDAADEHSDILDIMDVVLLQRHLRSQEHQRSKRDASRVYRPAAVSAAGAGGPDPSRSATS